MYYGNTSPLRPWSSLAWAAVCSIHHCGPWSVLAQQSRLILATMFPLSCDSDATDDHSLVLFRRDNMITGLQICFLPKAGFETRWSSHLKIFTRATHEPQVRSMISSCLLRFFFSGSRAAAPGAISSFPLWTRDCDRAALSASGAYLRLSETVSGRDGSITSVLGLGGIVASTGLG